jgi:DNA-binding GntR family transcriptional regulator
MRESVYEQLKNAIFSGAFAKGERLVERDIAAKLKVSRTPVREALRRLEAEGIIEGQSRQGLIVRERSADEIREIYLIREALESLAAECAARNATAADIRRLRRLAAVMDKVNLEQSAAPEEVFEAHRKFSEGCNLASHMPSLIHMIGSLREQISRFRSVSLRSKKRRIEAMEEHHKILEALAQRDQKLAAELTRQHVRRALEAYLYSIDEAGGGKKDV